MWKLWLFPEQASEFAKHVDYLTGGLLALGTFFTLAIVVALIVLMTRYRKGNDVDRHLDSPDHPLLEITWTVVPTIIALGVFVWGTLLFFEFKQIPEDALEIQVIGKQWMWKVQHANGRREVNEVHVPAGQPIKLTMISQDVLHSFFLPEFRVKQDVIPGRYTQMWFEAMPEKAGNEYHLFCAEYCGTDHSRMIGKVVVMEPSDYQTWLTQGNLASSPASAGEQLFTQLGCFACHNDNSKSRGPDLAGKFGTEETLDDGSKVAIDEAYIQESMLYPAAKKVKGYEPIMPAFAGQLNQEEIANIIAYIKSL
jgi:cytochrome c oxidase subunit 2